MSDTEGVTGGGALSPAPRTNIATRHVRHARHPPAIHHSSAPAVAEPASGANSPPYKRCTPQTKTVFAGPRDGGYVESSVDSQHLTRAYGRAGLHRHGRCLDGGLLCVALEPQLPRPHRFSGVYFGICAIDAPIERFSERHVAATFESFHNTPGPRRAGWRSGKTGRE